MTAISATAEVPEARVDSAQPSARKTAPEVGFLSQLSFAVHLDMGAVRAVAVDAANGWKVACIVALGGCAIAVASASSTPAVFVAGLAVAFSGWLAGATAIWILARGLGHDRADLGELARGLGLMSFPLMLLALPTFAGEAPLMLLRGFEVFVYSLAAANWVLVTRELVRSSMPAATGIGLVGICIAAAPALIAGAVL